jgi:hypothetical protein
MMVVIVVSRRVGQVTLAVSERTSCKNLNGLKAIVWDPRPSPDELLIQGDRTAALDTSRFWPNPLSKDEPASGLDGSGISKAAPDIRA